MFSKVMDFFKKRNKLDIRSITIETVLGCNLSCPACAIGMDKVTRKKRVMSLTDFQKIVEKVQPYKGDMFYLHIWGEPMLNSEIFEMIQIASKFSRTNISTNANTLDENSVKKLIDSGVSDLIFSIDGTTQEIYEQYRRNGNLSKAMTALKVAAQYKQFLDSPVNIIPQFCCFEHNEHQVEEFKEICLGLNLQPCIKNTYLSDFVKRAKNDAYVRHIESSSEKRLLKMRECKALSEGITILVDGSVVACCCDYDGVTSFGNIFTQSIEEIRNTQNFLNFQDNLTNGIGNKECLKYCLIY